MCSQQGALKVSCAWSMDVMKMKDGLKSAAMECGAPFMLEAGTLMMLQLYVDSSDIRDTQVSFTSVVHLIFLIATYTPPLSYL